MFQGDVGAHHAKLSGANLHRASLNDANLTDADQRSLTDCSTPMPATAGGEAMANEEQVKRLQQGVLEWNKWRNANRVTPVNLSGAPCPAERRLPGTR
jgi:uncharacterized protein YjbI with pentapeptide repeats